MALGATDLDMIPEDAAKIVLGGGGFLALVALIWNQVLKMISRDKTAIAGDKSERGQIIRLEDEIESTSQRYARDIERESGRADRAELRAQQYLAERDEALKNANEAWGEIHKLRAEIKRLEDSLAEMKRMIEKIQLGPPA